MDVPILVDFPLGVSGRHCQSSLAEHAQKGNPHLAFYLPQIQHSVRSRAGVRLRQSCLQLLKPVSVVHRDEGGEPGQLPKPGPTCWMDLKGITELKVRLRP